MDGAAGLVEVAARHLLLGGMLQVIPAARQRIQMYAAGMEMQRQGKPRGKLHPQDPEAVAGVQQ